MGKFGIWLRAAALLAAALPFSAGAEGAGSLAQPLTEVPGDPKRGLSVLRDGSKATCFICHSISSLDDPGQGVLGPALDGVAARYSAPELRARIVDARQINPDTIMPPYYSTEGLSRVGARWQGTTIYTAQEVEDVLAFLLTLKG